MERFRVTFMKTKGKVTEREEVVVEVLHWSRAESVAWEELVKRYPEASKDEWFKVSIVGPLAASAAP